MENNIIGSQYLIQYFYDKKDKMDFMKKIIYSFFLLLVFSCTNNAQKNNSVSLEDRKEDNSLKYEPSPLPIYLESMSDAKRKVMLQLQETDTSSYLIRARPVLFQIQGNGNNEDQTRYTLPFYKNVDLMIYALGEVRDTNFLDYGWIENMVTNEIVWRMTYADSKYAGGDKRNRKVVDYINLPAGSYRLRYVSNNSHANGDWHGDPPERPFYYGITAFNLYAINRINEMRDSMK